MTKNRILATVMAMTLLLSLLSGCSSVPGMSGGSSSNDDDRSSSSSTGTPAASSPDVSEPEDSSSGSGDTFYIGDKVSTMWFDFSVDSVEVQSEYEGYAAQEGKKLLVVELSLKSTYTSSTPMFQEDFVAGWDLEDDFEYVEPLSAYCEAQFPDEYSLGINESRTGILVYEVPAEQKDFWINFLEYFTDDSYGDSYFVYFTAE